MKLSTFYNRNKLYGTYFKLSTNIINFIFLFRPSVFLHYQNQELALKKIKMGVNHEHLISISRTRSQIPVHKGVLNAFSHQNVGKFLCALYPGGMSTKSRFTYSSPTFQNMYK